MKTIYRVTVLAVALIIAAAGSVPAVAYGSNSKKYEEEIIEYNLQRSSAESVQEWIDGDLTRDAGAGSEWYIIALSNYGEYDFSAYKNALNDYLSKNEVGSASSRLKFALTYIATGDISNPYISEAAENSIGEQGIMSLVFGLHLLNNGCVSDDYSLSRLIDEIISLQLDDGGWSIMGEYGDVDVTAMTVQALAVHYSNNSAVKCSIDDALEFLSDRQLDNGRYSGYGVENPESAAQVVIALSSLGTDICKDNRFIKNGNTVFDGMDCFQSDDGGFCHKEGGDCDSTATAQVLCASIAYKNMKIGKTPFYIFNKSNNISEEITTAEITTETVSTEAATTAETTVIINDPSKSESIFNPPESETKKIEDAESCKCKLGSVRLVIILVALIALLICTVLFKSKKHRFTVFIIVAAIVVTALVIKIPGNNSTDIIGSVTISISCNVIKNEDKNHIPKNGVILEETKIDIENGDTVYDVFSQVCKMNKIHFSSNMGYIEGINNIYEMDFGDNSGWIYFVNGESPSVGCDNYKLMHGDEIEWHYTCEMGKDLDINLEKAYNSTTV